MKARNAPTPSYAVFSSNRRPEPAFAIGTWYPAIMWTACAGTCRAMRSVTCIARAGARDRLRRPTGGPLPGTGATPSIAGMIPARRLTTCVLLLSTVAMPVCAQQVYKWTDASGQVHFSDLPPPTAVVPVEVVGEKSNRRRR